MYSVCSHVFIVWFDVFCFFGWLNLGAMAIKVQHYWSLTIRLFSDMIQTFVGVWS